MASPSDGERRQLTVLFADLVGSTSLSGLLDPEALRALLRAYQRACVASIHHFGGTVHQYAGDGVLAYFGYPVAHENDAERAVLAGLDLVARVGELAAQLREQGEPEIAVRIGIHTGMVVVGEMGAGSALEVHAIGETPNVAARVQGEATPNSVCISGATRQLLGQHLAVRSIGARMLKGVARAIELFVVEAVDAPALARFVDRPEPLIGRDRELAHLQERWDLARQGRGQAVLVSGEGGLGKSRLLAAFRASQGASAGVEGLPWRSVFCSPFYQNSALHPMIDLIEREIGRAGERAPPDRTAALNRAMARAGIDDPLSGALVASLLGLGLEHENLLQALSPDQRKRRTLDTLIAWLGADAQAGALVLLVEDLHWIDASTRDLIGTLLDRISEMPILAVLTYRPEFVPTWAMHGHVSTLPLSRLSARQAAELIAGVSGAHVLPAAVIDEVVKRTDGIPLFVEELTKAVLDARQHPEGNPGELQGGDAASALQVPATLRDSLTARLDRLGEAKAVAQLASVLGREFDHAVLQAISPLTPAQLEDKLAALNRAEIINQRGIAPRARYTFKHALIQEAAYDTLLKSTRVMHHRRAAEAYVQAFPDVVLVRPELVAHHFSRAQMPTQAVVHWQRAGEVAVSRSGYTEAMAHLGAALQQLALLPLSAERLASEVELRVKIGPALVAIKGMGAPETRANYGRACEIAEQLGDSAESFMALWGDWLTKTVSGHTQAAALRSEELVSMGRRLGHEDFVLQAHHSRWTNLYLMGNARVSRTDTLVGIEIYDVDRHRHHRHVYGGHDPGICACGTGANAAWQAGHAADAARLAARAISISQVIEHPFSEALAWFWSMMAAWGTGDFALARDRADALTRVCEKHAFRQWLGAGMLMSGACRTMLEGSQFGLKLVDDGLAEQRKTGQPAWQGTLLTFAATAHLRVDNVGPAIELLAEAVDVSEKTGARVLRPEALRLQAEALRQTRQIDTVGAVGRLQAALVLARQQGAVALEWRAARSLARVHLEAGQADNARHLLEATLSTSTEGFDSPDLAEARQMLQSLGSASA